jgi:hypothetical protein
MQFPCRNCITSYPALADCAMCISNCHLVRYENERLEISVAVPHHFNAAPVPGENFDAAPTVAPSLLYGMPKFVTGIKVNRRSDILFSSDFCVMKIVVNTNRKKTIKLLSLCY